MKWVPFDAPAFLEGCIGLGGEERGYYITVIALLIARTGKNVTDTLISQAMSERPQVWRRVSAQLVHKGKIWRQPDGSWMANRVQTSLETAAKRISLTRGLRLEQLRKQELNLGGNVRKHKQEIISLPWRDTARGGR